jgi:antitoxin (DNA-binding transcriptional repressor) of toxin-antitoxin stability system
MERRISKAAFKAKACELFRQVEAMGEKVIVTSHGKPTIEIRPYTSGRDNPLDILRAAIVHFKPEAVPDRTQRSENTP